MSNIKPFHLNDRYRDVCIIRIKLRRSTFMIYFLSQTTSVFADAYENRLML